MNESFTEDQHISLHPFLPWLVLACAVSVTIMVLGAGRADRILVSLAAALLAAFVVGAGFGINAPLWSRTKKKGVPLASLRSAIRCNVWLAAYVYFWGASALLGVYSLADLRWYHAHQYAAGALVFACGLSIIAWRIGQQKSVQLPHPMLSILHGAAAAGGVAFMVIAGKLATKKGDWVANEVFLWGGIAIIALCVMSLLTQMRPVRDM